MLTKGVSGFRRHRRAPLRDAAADHTDQGRRPTAAPGGTGTGEAWRCLPTASSEGFVTARYRMCNCVGQRVTTVVRDVLPGQSWDPTSDSSSTISALRCRRLRALIDSTMSLAYF